MTLELFGGDCEINQNPVPLAAGAILLRGFAASRAAQLQPAIKRVSDCAPFRIMTTRGGYRMSVAMTNCGDAGWVSDAAGYRYDALDPATGQHWPPMPQAFADLATAAADRAGFGGFRPDACLINRYEPGARLSLHQDKNEREMRSPIVSVSLGCPRSSCLAESAARSGRNACRSSTAMSSSGVVRHAFLITACLL
jgi:DNA oxidative demethylase